MNEISNNPYVTNITSKTPVFIEFTPNETKERGLSRDIDRFPQDKLERTPDEDYFDTQSQIVGANNLKALKVPNTTEITKAITVIPVVLETGKQILVGIFDIRDIWNERSGSKEPKYQAVILPDKIADEITANRLNAEA